MVQTATEKIDPLGRGRGRRQGLAAVDHAGGATRHADARAGPRPVRVPDGKTQVPLSGNRKPTAVRPWALGGPLPIITAYRPVPEFPHALPLLGGPGRRPRLVPRPCSPGSTPAGPPEEPPQPARPQVRRGHAAGAARPPGRRVGPAPQPVELRPAGRQLEVGDFPVNMAIHPSGQYLAVLHAGCSEHEVMIVDLNKAKPKIVSRVAVDQTFYGLCFSPDGRQLYASGGEFEVVHEFDFDRGLLGQPPGDRPGRGPARSWSSAGWRSTPTGRDLFACCPGATSSSACRSRTRRTGRSSTSARRSRRPKKEAPKGEPPSPPDGRKEPKDDDREEGPRPAADEAGVLPVRLPARPGRQAAVRQPVGARPRSPSSIWRRTRSSATWPTAEHPTEMVLSPERQGAVRRLRQLDAGQRARHRRRASRCRRSTAPCTRRPRTATRRTACALTPDGELLFVANADANNLAVFNVADRGKRQAARLHPDRLVSDVACAYNPTDKTLYVANGKGLTLASRTATGPNPLRRGARRPRRVHRRPVPAARSASSTCRRRSRWPTYTKTGLRVQPARKDDAAPRPRASRPTTRSREGRRPEPDQALHLHHQGEPHLRPGLRRHAGGQRRPEPVPVPRDGHAEPPHAGPRVRPARQLLRRRRGVGRRPRVDDGGLRHRLRREDLAAELPRQPAKKLGYPAEGQLRRDRPAGRRLPLGPVRRGEASATAATASGSRTARRTPTAPSRTARPRSRRSEGHFDPKFRGYDLDYPDVKRAERFIEELQRFEKDGEMPRLHDPAAAQRPHLRHRASASRRRRRWWPTTTWPSGRWSRRCRKSKFWKETAIFVVEDDAQNGPDHVDAHRTVALVISPYTKRKARRLDDVLDVEHAADDGADPGPEADEPVRRRRPADVQLVHRQAGLRRRTRTTCRRWT